MNAAHLHLLINHIPVLGSLFALMLLIPGAVRRDASLIKAALVTLIVAAIFAGLSVSTGDEAEHLIEKMNAIDNTAMEEHEEFGETAMWASYVTGFFALVTFVAMMMKYRMQMRLVWLMVVMAAAASFFMARTAYTGGLIRHSEIHIVPEH